MSHSPPSKHTRQHNFKNKDFTAKIKYTAQKLFMLKFIHIPYFSISGTLFCLLHHTVFSLKTRSLLCKFRTGGQFTYTGSTMAAVLNAEVHERHSLDLHCKKIRRFYGKIPGIWLPVLLPLFLRAFTCRPYLEIKIW